MPYTQQASFGYTSICGRFASLLAPNPKAKSVALEVVTRDNRHCRWYMLIQPQHIYEFCDRSTSDLNKEDELNNKKNTSRGFHLLLDFRKYGNDSLGEIKNFKIENESIDPLIASKMSRRLFWWPPTEY